MNELNFYNSYHLHPINKLIHTICIPLLMFATLNFFSLFKIVGTRMSGFPNKLIISLDTLLYNFYIFLYTYKFYANQSWFQFILTNIFMFTVFMYSYYFRLVNNIYDSKTSRISRWQKNNIKIFIFAWLLQFLGHYIEGNSPAFIDGLKQTFLYAPIFSLNNVITVIN